jgi:1-aminocyclopropane-1-carboxylate deaminase/D-cysteine desulfhydrase-like pyridoxal-dependent ACC family enzyme
MIPLFEHYPLLRDKIPYVSLAQLPTPIEKLDRLGGEIGADNLYIKRDDLTGHIYGGNKIRKLEFLLGRALQSGAREVMTFGAAGSNHALATAVYAKQAGLRSILILRRQPNSRHLRRNLLMDYANGAELHHYGSRNAVRWGAVYQQVVHAMGHGRSPQVIPLGGSSPLGVTGFVNAALELKEQIERGLMPEPDCIYVAAGTMGTAVGMTLGLMAANLRTRVVSIRVADEKVANAKKFAALFRRANFFLHSADPSFPLFEISGHDVNLRHDFFGQRYAQYTEDGQEAVAMMARERFMLEGTYTGKAFAALMHDAKQGDLGDKVVLFWNTANSRDFSDGIKDIDYHRLPRGFHRYFEEDVQPLDRSDANST